MVAIEFGKSGHCNSPGRLLDKREHLYQTNGQRNEADALCARESADDQRIHKHSRLPYPNCSAVAKTVTEHFTRQFKIPMEAQAHWRGCIYQNEREELASQRT